MTVLGAAWPALVVVLVTAAVGKVRDVRGFAAVIDGYRLLPRRLTLPAAVTVPAVEAVAAVLLVVPVTRRWGGLLSAALFAVFVAAMVSVLRRGLDVDCGCFGSSRGSRVGPFTVARTGLLLVLAVMTAVAGAEPFRAAQIVPAVVFLGLVGAVTLLGPRAPDAGGPRTGTRFTLGVPVETATAGAPTLFALVSPACGLCTAMLPAFLAARARMRVVLVSADEERAVRGYLEDHGVDLPVLIDPDVYDNNGIPWPPYAVVTDGTGAVLAADGADSPDRLGALLSGHSS
ncbi:TlpA family protein disulfide reductase [Actinoallomurus sp. CA-142502]|uniref:TlpA family protein disulfide reductase n=1 Tax=Actinoallomurus sp. CA-142502 TaxID=3239885 RepID=UPI003D927656